MDALSLEDGDHRDFYRLLNVTRNASADEIKKAFKKLSLQLHPDKNRDRSQYSHEMMTRLNAAKDTLLDPNRRQVYDDSYNDEYVPDQDEISGFLSGGKRISKSYTKRFEKYLVEFGKLLIDDNFNVVLEIVAKLKKDFRSMADEFSVIPDQDQSSCEPLETLQQHVITCPSDHVIELTAERLIDRRYFIMATDSVINQLDYDYLNSREIPQSSIYDDKLAKTQHLRSINKFEKAIIKQSSNWDKAMLYIDLTMATSGIAVIHCFVMAMTYLLEVIMGNENVSEAQTYAVCKIICELAVNVIVLAKRCALPITELHFNKLSFVIMSKAHQLLQAKLKNYKPKEGFFHRFFFRNSRIPTAMITETYTEVYKMMANTFTRLIRVTPFVDLPLTLTGDMIYLDVICDNFVDKFYQTRIDVDGGSLSYLYSYYLLECSWKVSDDKKFPVYREKAMDALLEKHGWFPGEVENTMMWEVINRDQDGWFNIDEPWLNLDGLQQYESVVGLVISTETGEFSVSGTESPPGRSGLFNNQDITDIFINGFQHSLFTLDPPSTELQYHPFHQLKYSPAALEQAPNLLQTLLHADYLLKMISTGVEVSAHYPHAFRNAQNGFMKLLPPHLREKLRPVTERRGGNRKDSCHRFWIESDELEYELVNDEDDNILEIVFGRCRMRVKTHLMKHNSDGELVDDSDDEDDVDSDGEDCVKVKKKRVTAETQFANDFTEVYDEVGRYFPVLLRLRELMKILAVYRILISHYEMLETEKNKLKSTLTERLGKSYKELRPKIPYPQNTSSNVDTRYRKLLSDQGINESHLASGEENRVKYSIRQQLRKVDEDLVSKLTEQLSKQLNVFHCQEFAKAVRNWLDGGIFIDYTKQLVNYSVDRIYPQRLAELDRFRKYATLRGVKLSQDDDGGTSITTFKGQCPWVPAAFCRYDLGRIYGGVCLIPQLKSVPHVQISNANNIQFNKRFINGGVTSPDARSRYYTDDNGVKHRKQAPGVTLHRGYEGRVEFVRSMIHERNLYGGTGTTEKMRAHVQRDFGRSTDQAGHVIGFVLGGSGSRRENIVPLSGPANRAQWHTVEKNVAQAVANHGKVMYRLEYMYTNTNTTRPIGFTWRYSYFDENKKVVSYEGFIDNPK